jgi:hypothetical protein
MLEMHREFAPWTVFKAPDGAENHSWVIIAFSNPGDFFTFKVSCGF